VGQEYANPLRLQKQNLAARTLHLIGVQNRVFNHNSIKSCFAKAARPLANCVSPVICSSPYVLSDKDRLKDCQKTPVLKIFLLRSSCLTTTLVTDTLLASQGGTQRTKP
jgi:hypothetical protein